MMEDEVGSQNFEQQALDNDMVTNVSAQAIENNLSVVTNDTSTENDTTNLATSPETKSAALENVNTTSTTFGAMDLIFSCDGQGPAKGSTKFDNSNCEVHIVPEIKQEPVAQCLSEGVLTSVQMDVILLPNITNSDYVQETVASKENVAIDHKETPTEIKTEVDDPPIVPIEDMDVTSATPVATTDNPKVVSQSAVTSPTSLGLLQKCEALSSITQYRGDSSDGFSSDSDSDSDSSSSSSCSSSSSSTSSEPLHIVLAEEDLDEGLGKGKAQAPIKTQDEVLIDELPEVEDLHISLPDETELRPMGLISSIVEKLVIVESFKDTPPLNDDSVVFSADREAVGKVFEVFGPVVQPFYVLRFNSDKDIAEKRLRTRDTVYFAPGMKDLTDYIFTDRLRQLQGSDASWKNDQEPPPEALDYSDDEKEAQAKRKMKAQRQENAETEGDKEKPKPGNKRPPKREPRQAWGGPRARGPPNPRAGPPHGPRAIFQHHLQNPHFRPPPPSPLMDSLHPPYRHPPPFQGPPPYFPVYPGPPPAHMPWPPHPFPGMYMPPPPPPPPPHPTNEHWPN
ncbi:hypothetical protein ACEWY4_001806 [Coilia grayii]|uniref:H/ACA ribonucleoprotein complex non-core subunit NAF1 n=1 Tax=Coilia grayii TaxID=363190 RepID=A0ABD1KU19_9TELE